MAGKSVTSVMPDDVLDKIQGELGGKCCGNMANCPRERYRKISTKVDYTEGKPWNRVMWFFLLAAPREGYSFICLSWQADIRLSRSV